jgi:hypothetical protein
MSDTPVDVSNVSPPAAGVSDVLNASLDAAAAAQHMQQLKDDPDFMKRVTAGDAEAFSQYNRLWRISRGMSPAPTPPQSPVEIGAEADGPIIAAIQQHAGFYRDRGYTEQQRIEIVGGRPITMEERRWQTQYNMKKSSRFHGPLEWRRS